MSNQSLIEKLKEKIFTNTVYYYSCLENLIRNHNVEDENDNQTIINNMIIKDNVIYISYTYKKNEYIWCNNNNIESQLSNFNLSLHDPNESKILSAVMIDNELETDVTDLIIKYGGHKGDFHKDLCFFKCGDILDDNGQKLFINNNTLKIITYLGDEFEYKKTDIIRI